MGASSAAAEVPLKFTYQGNLRQAGFLVNGSRAMVFRLFASSTAAPGAELWTSPSYTVAVSTGVFRVSLEPSAAALDSPSLWLELEVEGNRLAPREEITSAPYAINSALHSGKKYTTSPSAPVSPAKGDLWMNTALDSLYFWNGSGWVSTAGSGGAHAASHAGGGIDAITGLGAHAVTGDITFNSGVSLRSSGQGVAVSTNLIITGAINPSSNLAAGGAGYSVAFASSVWAGNYYGRSLSLSGAAGSSGDMLVVSTGSSNVVRLTGAGEVYALKFYGDASGLTGLPGGGGSPDNLGNHTATTTLVMGGNQITGAGAFTMSSFTASGTGLMAAQLALADSVIISSESSASLGAGLRVSTNAYIVGFASSTKFYGDGSALTGIVGLSGADNLGDHTAVMDLVMGGNQISGLGPVTMSSFTASGIGINAAQLALADNVIISSESSALLGGGVRVSSNVYIVGFASSTKFYGDGSALTGLTVASDNLGDHTATMDLVMGANQIAGSGSVTMSSFTATGAGMGAAQLALADNVIISSESSALLGGGVRVSSNIYMVGFSSSAKFYGDGSALTGLVAVSDNLGDHMAIMDLIMGGNQISGLGPVTMSSFTASGIGINAAQLALADNVIISSESSALLGGGVLVSSNVYIVGFASSTRYYGDGSALTGLNGMADNLGNHTAVMDLVMGANQITGSGSVTMSSFTASGIGINAAQLALADNVIISSESSALLGGGVRVSSNVYIVGFASSTKFYGDGSALTGVVLPGDNLGDHTATMDLLMGASQITGSGSVTMSSFTAAGAGMSAVQLALADNVKISSETSALLGAGVRISSHAYVAGFVSAAKFYGDGSGLSGLDNLADNMGNHTAAANLNMNGFNILDAGGINILSGTGLQIGGMAGSGKYLRGDGTRFVPMSIQAVDLPVSNAAPYVLDTGDTMTGQLTLAGSSLTVTGADGMLAPKYNFGAGINISSTAVDSGGLVLSSQLLMPGLVLTQYGEFQTRGVGRGIVAGDARGAGAVDLQVKRAAASNAATGAYSVISGGQDNTSMGDTSAVSGGAHNIAAGQYSIAGGGQDNTASGTASMVPGGFGNTASGDYSLAAGRSNTASGAYSMALGLAARASAAGAFTWADSQGTLADNSAVDRVKFKAQGGFVVSGSTASSIGGAADRGFVVTGTGLVGVSNGNPQAPLDVVAAGDTSSDLASAWRNSAGTNVAQISADGVVAAAKFLGDSSGLLGVPVRIYTTVALTGTVNDYVHIGSFNSPSGMHNLYVSVTITLPTTGFSVSRQYTIPIYGNMTGGAWRVVMPLSNTGPFNGNDFNLEASVAGNVAVLRLRRTAGSTAGTAVVNIEQSGPSDDVFTAGSQTGSDAAQYPFLPVTSLTQTGGMAGVNTLSPRSRFDVFDGSVSVRGLNAALVMEDASRVISAEPSELLGGGFRVSTNVYIVGFSSSTKFYGDGSTLAHAYDDLGNHTATTTVNMNGHQVINISSMAITGAGVTGSARLLSIAGSTMVVLNNGNVGLGLADPVTQLHLTSGITSQSSGEAAGPGQLRLDNAAGSLAATGGIEFKTTGVSGGSGSKIQAVNAGGSQLIFAGRQSNSAWSEYMRIGTTGNVGIGTSGPVNKLEVYSAEAASVTITGTGDSGFAVTNSAAAQTWSTYVDDTGAYRIGRAGGGSEFIIDPVGRIGISTMVPSSVLEVNGVVAARSETASAQAFRALGRAADNFAWAPLALESDGTTPMGGMSYTPSAITLRAGGGLTSVMTWLPSGNVGVGTAVPAATLDVAGTDAVKVPVGTTAQRPALPINGMLRMNTTTGVLEYCSNGWIDITGTRYETPQTVADMNGYRIHTFFASGIFTVPAGVTSVDYLVVAGGGGGGSAGGGGGGGMRTGTLAVTPGDKTVTVGLGGAGVNGKGLSGGNSAFDSISATGGGGGGGNNLASPGSNGANGGSGGGAGFAPGNTTGTKGTGNAGAYAPAEGNDGGTMVTGGGFSGGGGGGAGAAGGTGPAGVGGNGGNGTASSISGYNTVYAGGGAGSGEVSLGTPGTGGGGLAAMGGPGGAGIVNTGGGGGGSNLTGGSGGSGIVIIRYQIPAVP